MGLVWGGVWSEGGVWSRGVSGPGRSLVPGGGGGLVLGDGSGPRGCLVQGGGCLVPGRVLLVPFEQNDKQV